MHFMIVEHYRGGDPVPVYRRFRDRGRMAPDGLRYVASWVTDDLATCYQVMEAADPALLETWMAAWRDLVEFEVIPVMPSAEAAAAVAPRLGGARSPSLDSFETERLRAERLLPEHLPDIVRMDGNVEMMATLGGVRDEAKIREYMARNLAHWEEYGHGAWMIRESASGRLAGRAVLRHYSVDGVDELEIGYAFLPEFWRRGFASEIARACMKVGYEGLGRDTLVAVTTRTNAGSRRVLEKAGFTLEREIEHSGSPHLLYRWRAARGTPAI